MLNMACQIMVTEAGIDHTVRERCSFEEWYSIYQAITIKVNSILHFTRIRIILDLDNNEIRFSSFPISEIEAFNRTHTVQIHFLGR